jgi:hypothetical protein
MMIIIIIVINVTAFPISGSKLTGFKFLRESV